MLAKNHHELDIWQLSMELVTDVYRLTCSIPVSEKYGICQQMRRAAVSIPSNIAEGSRRSSRKDFRNFLLNSYGSGAELETQIKISKKLLLGEKSGYLLIDGLLEEVMRMLNKLTHELN